MMVLMRCATVITVLSLNSSFMTLWMDASVSASTAAVASSIMTTLEPFNKARAITSNCRCPTLKLLPPSVTSSANELMRVAVAPKEDKLTEEVLPETALLDVLYKPTRRRTSYNASSEWSSKGSKLVRTVPEYKTGSCGITAMLARSFARPTCRVSWPSISMHPSASSTIRSNPTIKVDFPAPVRPTTPTLLPAGILISSPFNTNGRPGLYRSLAPLISMAPLEGHPFGRDASTGVRRSPSASNLAYS
mmetsp:Transcript_33416/g.80893  ORF Transcript_33416/g.80893 Transcript_33416/m.80893 type:complete len:248 (+) Transcript_33416:214-957(+)